MDVLVDSSVWIQFLNSQNAVLRDLLKKNSVCTNDVVLLELLPFFRMIRNQNALELLDGNRKIPIQADWNELMEMRLKNLQNGINNVGIPDLLILQQAIQHKLPICSLDKHFKLMKEVFDFELIEG